MKLKGLLIYLISFLASASVEAQQHNFRHYTTRDGLPSSTVYSILQDDEGYMWFSTSQGVVRFDGYKFKTYTVLDGLPDNDVLAMFKGQKGKIWFIAFNKQISYYDADTRTIKIYDKYNLPSLPMNVIEMPDEKVYIGTREEGLCVIDGQTITLLDTSNLPTGDNFALPLVDDEGLLWISSRMRFFQYRQPPKLYDLNDTDIPTSEKQLGDFAKLHQLKNGTMLCYMGRQVFGVKDDGTLSNIFPSNKFKDPNLIINSVQSDAASNILIATQAGAIFLPSDSQLPVERYLTNKPLSHFYEDMEGNYWFTSLNDGIYMLPRLGRYVKNVSLKDSLANIKIISFGKIGEHFFFGANNGAIGGWINGSPIESTDKKFYLTGLSNCNALNDTLYLCTSNYGFILLKTPFNRQKSNFAGFNGYDSIRLHKSFTFPLREAYVSLSNVKSLLPDRNLGFWAGGRMGLMNLTMDKENGTMHVTQLVSDRITDICLDHNEYLWFTTLDSIGHIDTGNNKKMMHLDSFGIKGNVTQIIKDNYDHLWFTTSGYGMYVYDGDSLYNISLEHGLSSAFINTAITYKNDLIIGTTSGINVVQISSKPPYFDQAYSVSVNNAFLSQEVNAFLVHEDSLYIGTNLGISIVPLSIFAVDTLLPKVYLSKIQINDNDTLLQPSYTLPYYLNDIKFEFLGILFKADGNLVYRYQMEGIDSGWVQTTFTNAQYPTLPPGNYNFKVDSRSLQGPWSGKPATMQITILSPFWQTWWFRLSIGGAIAAIVLGLSYGVIRYYRNQSKIAQRMVQLEGQALRAQMNPHFIFNALNAIHDFIANQDERSAHLYLGKFALLIRKILDQSRKQEISLEEEVLTLKLYLELEALRFPDQFHYSIDCPQSLLENDVQIPPMLVQPYVENAIRHGLMNSDRSGKLNLAFQQVNNLLEITIEDNGIGRKKAMEISSKRLTKHRSAGMEITHQRIALQALQPNTQENLTIVDLMDNENQPRGTRVTFYVTITSNP